VHDVIIGREPPQRFACRATPEQLFVGNEFTQGTATFHL
jgi:hypothetical protein